MRPARFHSWNLTPREAAAIQDTLRDKVKTCPLPKRIQLIAGADVSFDTESNLVHAAVTVLRFPELTLVEHCSSTEKVTFPYIPGLLAFREGPPIVHAFQKLENTPDVVMFDAHGVSHPRRFGLASHLGVIFDLPSIGVAKKVLVGSFNKMKKERGNHSTLVDGEEEIGLALHTKDSVNPIFISVGHKSDLHSSMDIVLSCATKYRTPEPTRQADIIVNSLRKGDEVDLGLDVDGGQTSLF